MKVSVVMCCYNGEKYIYPQLESLRNQTRMPDEILIIDDCSQDNTVKIVKEYIEKNNLQNWEVIENNENKGWKKNFIWGMSKAQGDIIFPCDQDDIWNIGKIEKMSNIMEKDDKVSLLVANYTLYYEGTEYRKVSNLFTKEMKFDEKYEQLPLSKKALYIYRPGCVMAVKKELFDIAKQYMFEDYPHDALIWRTALFLNGLYLYNFSAIHFRRHNSNASDAVRHKAEDKIADIDYYIKVSEHLEKMVTDLGNDKEKKELLKSIIQFMKIRKEFYKTKSIRLFLLLLFKYKDYYITSRALLGDLYINMFEKRR